MSHLLIFQKSHGSPMASLGAGDQIHNFGVPTTMFLPPLRLDRNNYFFWRSQVLPPIRAHDLESILLNRNPPQP
ncbi:hypothetical protein CsatB_017439 [Cannabis sativa]